MKQKMITDAIRALFIENPPGELGPSDEPDSVHRLGYNSAIEDALDAVEKLSSALAAEGGEPVAWQWQDIATEKWHTLDHEPRYHDGSPVRALGVIAAPHSQGEKAVASEGQAEPLIAHPRERVSMTYTQFTELAHKAKVSNDLNNQVLALQASEYLKDEEIAALRERIAGMEEALRETMKPESIADTAGAKAVSAEQALQMAVNALHYSHDLEEGSRKVRALLSGARAGDFKNEPFAWHVAKPVCTCKGVLGHSRQCAAFDEAMMRPAIDAAGASEGDVRDAKRLDWMLSHSHMRVQGSKEKGYRVWDCGNGLSQVAVGDTERAAIDAAIAKENGDE